MTDELSPATPLVSAPVRVRILIVDDDARLRRATATALSRIGFHVITAGDTGPASRSVLAKPAHIAELRHRMIAAARTQQAYVEAHLARER